MLPPDEPEICVTESSAMLPEALTAKVRYLVITPTILPEARRLLPFNPNPDPNPNPNLPGQTNRA